MALFISLIIFYYGSQKHQHKQSKGYRPCTCPYPADYRVCQTPQLAGHLCHGSSCADHDLVGCFQATGQSLVRFFPPFGHNCLKNYSFPCFFLIVTPMGLIRKAFGADPMKTKLWKRGGGSVLVERNHLYTKEDIEKSY